MKISLPIQTPALALGFALSFTTMPAAFAVDDLGLFELDGNAVEPNFAGDLPGDDWETLFDGGGSANVFTDVTPDPAPVSIFTGGRKDIQDISDWGWKDGAVPDKGDITNAYAAAYEDDGDLIVYFGADRVANAGDTFLGFWFFKSEVTLNPDGSFDGAHQPGDTLVLVNFPQAANAVPLIQVVEWDPTCAKADSNNPQVGDCAAANLRLRAGVEGAGAICDPNVGPQLACAITNEEFTDNASPGVDSTAPWPYESKDGTVGEFPFETFFEGGINLTELIGGDACFSSFMAETRSSSSFTASLKDFVLDAFPVCAISVAKACANPVLTTDDTIMYDITGTVTNDGFGTVYDIDVTDSPAFDADSLQFVDCQDPMTLQDPASLPGGESICYEATITVPLEQNGTMDMVTATANTSPGGMGTDLSATATATCPVLMVNPMASVSKNCAAKVSIIGIVDPSQPAVVAEVNFSGEVCNTGDSRLDNVTVTDDKAGVVLGPISLAKGACVPFSGSYIPTEAKDAGGVDTMDPTKVVFKDSVEVMAQDIFGMELDPKPTAMATCPLCPEPTP